MMGFAEDKTSNILLMLTGSQNEIRLCMSGHFVATGS